MQENMVYIIAGHYGSGKTEFSINFARYLLNRGRSVTLADLDIVNPYFRSREKAEELAACGIHVVSNNYENDNLVDAPAISCEVQSLFLDRHKDGVVDLGGDAVGATVLRCYRELIRKNKYELWFVINANRYMTPDADAVCKYMDEIRCACGLDFTGLVNNTHLLHETSVEDVQKGDVFAKEVSNRTKLPVKFTCCPAALRAEIEALGVVGEVMDMKVNLRPDWLQI